jgi:hypothetical protein
MTRFLWCFNITNLGSLIPRFEDFYKVYLVFFLKEKIKVFITLIFLKKEETKISLIQTVNKSLKYGEEIEVVLTGI